MSNERSCELQQNEYKTMLSYYHFCNRKAAQFLVETKQLY
jgi:hypothetical protein